MYNYIVCHKIVQSFYSCIINILDTEWCNGNNFVPKYL